MLSDKKLQGKILNSYPHPLDPLTFEEINIASKIVKTKSNLGKELLFETIMLIEPLKEIVLSYKSGDHFSRDAFVVVLNYKKEKMYELNISIDQEKILNCEEILNAQPAFMFGDIDMDFNQWEAKMKEDPKLIEVLNKRGITDPSLLMIDPWPIANFVNS